MVIESSRVLSPGRGVKRLVRAVQELSLAKNMDTVMGIVRTVARELSGADGATFVLRDGNLCFYADEDAITPLWKGSRFPMQACVSGWSMLNRKPAIIEDIYKDSRIPIDAYRPTFVKSLLMVPIRTIDPIGAIGNYWAVQHMPTGEEVELLQSLADVTAVTLENIRILEELELRVKERTAQLEVAYHDMEAFSYSVSHDLRAPLRSIIGYSTILKEDYFDTLDQEGKRTLTAIQNSSGRMNVLIDDLLNFSKLGRINIVKSRVNMHEVVQSVVEEINKSIQHKASVQIMGQLLSSLCDNSLIRQVWYNLISNAIKYSSKREISMIEISSHSTGDEIVYSVKDNGVGFNMDYVNKLFGFFQRLHKASDFEGTGVGLAIVKQIIQRHGGRVWAEGVENQGATFYFSLPDNP
jgi:signal transduction histidine kinase